MTQTMLSPLDRLAMVVTGGITLWTSPQDLGGHGIYECFQSQLESLGFAQNFLSSCESEALHLIGIRSFGEEFREDVVFRGIQEKFRKPLA